MTTRAPRTSCAKRTTRHNAWAPTPTGADVDAPTTHQAQPRPCQLGPTPERGVAQPSDDLRRLNAWLQTPTASQRLAWPPEPCSSTIRTESCWCTRPTATAGKFLVGYVDIGESPAAACRRELREELDLDREPQHLLVVDWAPDDGEGDKVLWLFDCGTLGDDEQRIILDDSELDRCEWAPVSKIDDYVIPRRARRLTQADSAYMHGGSVYLEYG
ncbi:NUDIX hydrolase [Actinosynnema sp. NPDC050436]|uniref:NUDIX hydrolase n=1 Tax=Actinosynnema sp. NPDC050436 TaxID=3155659 RepID=UPI0033C46C46